MKYSAGEVEYQWLLPSLLCGMLTTGDCLPLSSGVDRCRYALDRPIVSACRHNLAAVPCRKVPSHMALFLMA